MIRAFLAVASVLVIAFVLASAIAGELSDWSPLVTFAAGVAAVYLVMWLLTRWSDRVLRRRFPTPPS